MNLSFPVIQVSDDSITTFRDDETFRRALSLTTDNAMRAGFFERARLFDASLVEYRLRQLELGKKSGLFGWMTSGREIKVLEMATGRKLEFLEVKALIANTVRNSVFWSENEDVEALERKIEAALTFLALAELFG